ncbi:hypothetical protein J8273_0854 [Carpediemonas membranifera]|uniref:Uncharacterized protein n=1 Tax=Carpediemonas membranifera TaxID=201153 RepID=A0A8J6BA81_9EUKA|nr:hypothetical protein J8273_0854 [Carpediemonas membranifera]|eukprot:KAG9397369.1 hypothetical protein J8273_0854 [Carpediemonas membranifera]
MLADARTSTAVGRSLSEVIDTYLEINVDSNHHAMVRNAVMAKFDEAMASTVAESDFPSVNITGTLFSHNQIESTWHLNAQGVSISRGTGGDDSGMDDLLANPNDGQIQVTGLDAPVSKRKRRS